MIAKVRWRDFNLQGRALMPGGLFWRTFMLIGLLMMLSLGTWVVAFRAMNVTPQAEQFAQHITSIVNTTRAAIQHSAPEHRRSLLQDLAQNESIRIYPLESDDITAPMPASSINTALYASLRARLGKDTQVAGQVNGVDAIWVSFRIDDDNYWVSITRDRFDRLAGIQWLFWGTAAVLLSLVGAALVVGFVNQPLARIGRAAMQLARGQSPTPLPDSNLREIRMLNEAFNGMVGDLQRLEADRTLILAGISHDLRTPMARLGLEVEMARISEDTKLAMAADIHQMDMIVAQFLDYAKPRSKQPDTLVDLSAIVDAQADLIERQGVQVSKHVSEGIKVTGNETELTRAVTNLIDNARKYGRKPEAKSAEIEVWLRLIGGRAVFEVLDNGPGVPAADLDRIKRPFTRANEARSQASGAGLGLAIVGRVVRRSGGKWRIANRPGGGLAVMVELPLG
jgi:two-component system osmolarity sensor histidine kinase EnvZ